MSKIVEARTHDIEVPLIREFSTSNKTVTSSRIVLVELRSDDGAVGWGESPFNKTFTSESPTATAEALATLFEERVLRRSTEEVVAGWPEARAALGERRAGSAALNIALWDLRARQLGVPVHALLGGPRRASVPVVWHVGNFDLDADAADAADAVANGFRMIKLKVGRADVAEDLEAVRRVREAVGDRARLLVDANQAWGRDRAAAFVDRCPELGVELVEQPVAAWDRAGLGALSTRPGTAVGADESCFTADELLGFLTAGQPLGAAVIKLLKAGGVDGVRDLLAVCRLGGVRPFLAGMAGDTSVVSAAMLHLALTAEELPLGTAITPHFSKADVAAAPLEVVDGELRLEQLRGPGLGVEVDLDLVDALRVG